MKRFSIWHWLIFIVAAAITALLIAGFVASIRAKDLGSSEAASWMQAIGSIGAIVVALAVGHMQRESDRRLEIERRHHHEAFRFDVVKAILTKTNVTVANFGEAWKKDAVDAASIFSIRHILDCKASIQSLPPFEIPDPNLVVYLSSLPRAIDDLCESIDAALKQIDDPERLDYEIPVEGLVFENMDTIMRFTSEAGAICDHEIAKRKR